MCENVEWISAVEVARAHAIRRRRGRRDRSRGRARQTARPIRPRLASRSRTWPEPRAGARSWPLLCAAVQTVEKTFPGDRQARALPGLAAGEGRDSAEHAPPPATKGFAEPSVRSPRSTSKRRAGRGPDGCAVLRRHEAAVTQGVRSNARSTKVGSRLGSRRPKGQNP